MKKILNEKVLTLKKVDYLILGTIVLFYTILSFINLGSTTAPQTFQNIEKGNELIIELKHPDDVIKIKYFNGNLGQKYKILTSKNKTVDYLIETEGKGAFSWNEVKILQKVTYLKIIPEEDATLGEIALYNNSKEKIPLKQITLNNKKITTLTDEAKTIPKQITHLNSSYFDEIYFARSAYEYANNLEAYDWVHPPLGKLIQSIPIKLFHTMAPFYYRLMGNIAGILMIIIMYLFSKNLFQKRKYAILGALLITFDCFHFAQTRMGTIDSFLVLFIMLSFYFMYNYTQNEKKKTINLFLSGLFFGCSATIKWSGLYASLPLAIIFFIYVIKNKKITLKLFFQCLLFFILIPLSIYIGSYAINPNVAWLDNFSLTSLIAQTKRMYNYHSTLTATHFFSSPAYTWPLSYKPVWYYSQDLGSSLHAGISGVGNVAIWWMGIIAFFYIIYKMLRHKDQKSLYLFLIIIIMFLPNLFIKRAMFLYHYFPVLPFVMLAIVSLFKDLTEKTHKNIFIYIYTIIFIVIFIIYYPAISGTFMPKNYFEYIKLFSTWYF